MMKDRIKEPSTMAGVSVLLALFGLPGPELVEGLGQVIAGVAALAAIFMRERGEHESRG